MDVDFAAGEFVGNRIDQERHVVVDDMDDAVPTLEAVDLLGRVEHPDLGDAGQAAAGESQQGQGHGGALFGRGSGQILVGQPLENPPREAGALLAAGPEGSGRDGIQAVKPRRRCDGHILCFLSLASGGMLRRRVTI